MVITPISRSEFDLSNARKVEDILVAAAMQQNIPSRVEHLRIFMKTSLVSTVSSIRLVLKTVMIALKIFSSFRSTGTSYKGQRIYEVISLVALNPLDLLVTVCATVCRLFACIIGVIQPKLGLKVWTLTAQWYVAKRRLDVTVWKKVTAPPADTSEYQIKAFSLSGAVLYLGLARAEQVYQTEHPTKDAIVNIHAEAAEFFNAMGSKNSSLLMQVLTEHPFTKEIMNIAKESNAHVSLIRKESKKLVSLILANYNGLQSLESVIKAVRLKFIHPENPTTLSKSKKLVMTALTPEQKAIVHQSEPLMVLFHEAIRFGSARVMS